MARDEVTPPDPDLEVAGPMRGATYRPVAVPVGDGSANQRAVGHPRWPILDLKSRRSGRRSERLHHLVVEQHGRDRVTKRGSDV
jgi:hypothetical protein